MPLPQRIRFGYRIFWGRDRPFQRPTGGTEMPIEKTIKLFRYDELSERAKERAREWYLSGLYWPHELDHVLEQWKSISEKLGFAVDDGPWRDLYRGTFEIGRGRFFRDLDDDDLDALEKKWGPNPETGWEGNTDVLALIDKVRAIRPNKSARIEDDRIYDVVGWQDHLTEPYTDYPGEEWDAYFEQA